MVREGKAESELGGALRAEIARAEQPSLGRGDVGRHRLHVAKRMLLDEIVGEKAEQLVELLRKIVRENGLPGAAQSQCGYRIGAGRTAQTEGHASRVQRLEDT